MSRSNYDKPFYVDVGTSIAAIRCASDGDVIDSLDHHGLKDIIIKIIENKCDRMNREFELYAKSKVESTQPTCDWSVKDALNFANTLANHGWTRDANADAASSCIYALCRMLKERGNAAAMREALLKAFLTALKVCEWEEGTDMDGVKSIISEIESAISAPPRNCDVGTAGEQYRRWTCFCKFRNESRKTCLGCPVYEEQNKGQNSTCELVWAQMPYEEGGAE